MNARANYGGVLQAYALVTALRRLGNEAEVIYLYSKKRFHPLRTPYRIFKRICRKYLKGESVTILYERKVNYELPIVSANTQKFINKYIPYVEVRNYKKLKSNDWDALVVGSDQVWRPDYQWELLPDFFLKFASKWKIKKIAYAPSFGTDVWNYSKKQEKVCGQLLQLFNAVSVRERSAVDLCKEHWDVTPEVVLDPTLLLSRSDYEEIIKQSYATKSPGDLLCYVLDENEEKRRIINNIVVQQDLTPFRINSRYEDLSAPLNERIQPPVEQWLRGFMDAKFVVTDSFHACVFSIIFNKPFVVIGNKERGMARFISLLSMFGLEERLIDMNSSYSYNCELNIDWEQVNKNLNSWREKSSSFIKNALIPL